MFRDTVSAVEGSQYDDGSARWVLTSDTPPRRTCTVRGYRTQKFNTASFRELDYLMGRFGATGPTALGWELIPFSFVLDWFVDLRNITDRLDNLLTGNQKRILDVCLSEVYQAKASAKLNVTGNYTSSNNGMELCTDIVRHYHRNPVLDYNIVRGSGRFGKKQASLLAALLHQMMANLVR